MRFIETPIFTKEIQKFLTGEEYRFMQLALVFRPDQGSLIPKSGGLRKLRWGFPGKGKRGGCRIIYYWEKPQDTIYMLYIYPKSKQDDLTTAQIKLLSKLADEEFHGKK
jgi:mRNA-degrading endonuclease RelE of RelBE toxin-antitoxin system